MIADNQQERFCELSWLGGIFDGEGSIGFNKRKIGNPRPRARVTNTNLLMIDKIKEILDSNGIYYQEESRKGKKRNKDSKTIVIIGPPNVRPFLKLLKPYLYSKQKIIQTALVLEYCSRRQLNTTLTKRDKEIIQEVRKLNYRGTN